MIANKSYALPVLTTLLAAALISGCDDDDTDIYSSAERSYEITLTNLTANQPLSPPAVIMHQTSYRAFTDGSAASSGLELLAEGGDNSELLTAAKADSGYLDSLSGSQAIGPGDSDTYHVSANDGTDAHLSIISMLVNTNDGFTASNALDLTRLALNQPHKMELPVWDAGTEANTEAQGTIPGPADQGEGFNAARDDIVDFVGFHRGVISAADGLSGSVLNESHRFDNPAALLTITRTQ